MADRVSVASAHGVLTSYLNNSARPISSVAIILAVLLSVSPSQLFSQAPVVLVTTGSTMPESLYMLWGDEYHQSHPQTELRYLPVGTSESANSILSGSGDLGGGDAPLPEQQAKSAARPVVELPTVLVGIAVFYNLPGSPASTLRLSGPVLANIYMGKTTSWNDQEIAKLNPEFKLPSLPINVLHRTDGKGSNYIFSDFLSKVSPDFRARVGTSVSPKWPVGHPFSRCQDLLDNLAQTPGAIGYAELRCADKSTLSMAAIRNASGEFVHPSSKSIGDVAVAMDSKMNSDFRVSLTNAPGQGSYPIVSFTWFYVPVHPQDVQRSRAVNDYLQWVYGPGQEIARAHGYTTLPPSVLQKVRAKVAALASER